MIAHLIGANPCRYATSAARRVAKELRGGQDAGADADDENGEEAGPSRKKRKLFSNVEKSITQTELKVYKGISIPFSSEQTAMVKKQFLRATISANLPFRWTEDPEVIKLFLLFQSSAFDVIPARKALGGCLLDRQSSEVEQQLREVLKGRYVTLS
jgi:hypothetical protein